MLMRFLMLCLVWTLAFPAGAGACAKEPVARAAMSVTHEACHETGDAPMVADAAMPDHDCGCAMHQAMGIPEHSGVVHRAQLLRPLDPGTSPVLRGLPILPLSPPPNAYSA